MREDILYTTSGEVQSPIDLNPFLIATKFVFSFLGLPLNVFLSTIIARLRRLRSKPRNIFLLGIFFSNLIIYVPPIIELLYWIQPDVNICKAYISVVGLPYIILLWNILCALIDRYVAITYPMWHRKKVTVRGVGWFLIVSSASLVFIVKFVYIFEIVPFKCDIRTLHAKIAGWTTVILFILCVIVHVVLYRRTKSLLVESRTIQMNPDARRTSPNRNNEQIIPHRQDLVAADEHNQETEDPRPNPMSSAENHVAVINAGELNRHDTLASSSHMFIHMPNGTLSKLELAATANLTEGVTSLFIFSSPLLLFFFCIFFCNLLAESECGKISWLAPYVKEFGLVHAVYNPIIYIFRNEELWTVLKSKFNRLSSGQ